MFKEKKSIMKSVRLTEKVSDYIENFEGDGFNQKLENLVLFCMDTEDKKKAEIFALTEELNCVRHQLSSARSLLKYANAIDKAIGDFVNLSGLIIKEL